MGCGVGVEDPKNGVGDGEPKKGLGVLPKKGLGEEAKKGLLDGEGPKDGVEEGPKGLGDEGPKRGVEGPKDGLTLLTWPLSDLFLTPNLPGFCLTTDFCPRLFLDLTSLAEDLGVSAMSFWIELNTEAALLSSITPDTVVISATFLKVVVIFSVFFIKSVNIWNLSSSDILLGVVPATGSLLAAVVWAGGSPPDGPGVVKGVKEPAPVVEPRKMVPGSRFLKRFGRGLNLLGNDGRRGLNLFWNNFFLSVSTLTSLRSVSSCSSSLSPGSLPNIVWGVIPDTASSFSVEFSSSSSLSRSGTSVLC